MIINITLDMDKEEDRIQHRHLVQATDMYCALAATREEVFRPARKHGYHDVRINKLIEACGLDEQGYSRGEELIALLEDIFNEVTENIET